MNLFGFGSSGLKLSRYEMAALAIVQNSQLFYGWSPRCCGTVLFSFITTNGYSSMKNPVRVNSVNNLWKFPNERTRRSSPLIFIPSSKPWYCIDFIVVYVVPVWNGRKGLRFRSAVRGIALDKIKNWGTLRPDGEHFGMWR